MTDGFLGVIVLDAVIPRIPGDVANNESYEFPIRIAVARDVTVGRVITDPDPGMLTPILDAARELEQQGAFALTTGCGFVAPLQPKIAQAVSIPVFASALMQIELAHRITGRRVGIITADQRSLSASHLRSAGVAAETPIAIAGLQDEPAFSSAILNGSGSIDPSAIEDEVLTAAKILVAQHDDIGAFVLECHNLAPYAAAIGRTLKLPVFDIVSFAEWVYGALRKRSF